MKKLIVIFVFPLFLLGQAQIDSVSPIQNAINVSSGTDISATFDTAMDSLSINDTTFIAMGNLTGLHLGSISYNSGTMTATLNPAADFVPGEVVTVMLTSGITDTAGVPIEGYVWNFTIAALNGPGILTSSLNFPANSGSYGIYTAFLDNDSNLDLVVTNLNSEDISVLFGIGDGTFSAPINYATGAQPASVACGDLDRDGDNDCVVASSDDCIYIYLNDGLGGLALVGQFDTGTEPGAVFLSDFDRDGNIDAATANSQSNDISILLGNGDGTFQTRVNYAAGSKPSGIYGGDFDEDGDVDLAVSLRNANEIRVLINAGDGTFLIGGQFVTGNKPDWVYAASLNSGDNFLDLTVPNTNIDNISRLLGNGDCTFGASVEFATSIAPIHLLCADMDADTDLDVIVSNSGSDSVSLLFNDGNGNFALPDNFYGDGGVSILCAGDFNNDGSIDIAVACFNEDSGVAVLLNISDTIPPGPPENLTANGSNPSPWANNPKFEIDWTNPPDPSGINRALYKLGTAPISNYDTTGTLSGIPPDSATATAEAGQMLYLWLEDNAGNIDFNNNAQVELRYDGTPPSGSGVSSPLYSNTLDFDVSWTSGDDTGGSGLSGTYDVKVKDGTGPWVDWLTNYAGLSATYTGDDGHIYYFEAGARDSAGNIEAFTGVPECSTIVDTTMTSVGPEFDITFDPSPAYIGNSVEILAVPDKPLHTDSAVICSVWTSDSIIHTLTLLPDSVVYINNLSTVGFAVGECRAKVSGYDLWGNYGFSTATFSISPGGEFLPEEMVYAWPNPARDNNIYFHFYVNANADIIVDVFNLEGKRVVRLEGRGEGGKPPHQQSSNAIIWDISNIASDVYIFRLSAVSDATGEKKSVIKKFAIVK